MIDYQQLARDMVEAKHSIAYNNQYRITLLKPNSFLPFRVYLSYQGEEYTVTVNPSRYRFTTLWEANAKFDNRIPTCPNHSWSWHPNVKDDGNICWGSALLLPGNPVLVLLDALNEFLHSPKHGSGYRNCAR